MIKFVKSNGGSLPELASRFTVITNENIVDGSVRYTLAIKTNKTVAVDDFMTTATTDKNITKITYVYKLFMVVRKGWKFSNFMTATINR